MYHLGYRFDYMVSNERALFTALIVSEQRIRRLELEVRQLRDALGEMRKKKED